MGITPNRLKITAEAPNKIYFALQFRITLTKDRNGTTKTLSINRLDPTIGGCQYPLFPKLDIGKVYTGHCNSPHTNTKTETHNMTL